jgi:hypothetical protein
MAYFEIEFEDPADLIRAAKEGNTQIFVDEFVNINQCKYWFVGSVTGVSYLYSCLAEPEEMNRILNSQPLIDPFPKPIRASFSEVR